MRKDYLPCVNLAADSALWLAYPMSLREPLPTIPIPCRPNDLDIPLSLQPLIANVYRDGRHDDIDYLAPLQLPLSADDAT